MAIGDAIKGGSYASGATPGESRVYLGTDPVTGKQRYTRPAHAQGTSCSR